MNKGTGEKATLEFVEAAMDAFGAERLRWLVGKGDVLIQNGQLTQEKFDELVRKTVCEEIERSVIERQLREGPMSVVDIAEATGMVPNTILMNLLAMMKWNRVEIVSDKGAEYQYAIKETTQFSTPMVIIDEECRVLARVF